MSKRRDSDYLNDIREGIHRILTYTAELTYEQFYGRHQDSGCSRAHLEIIGEVTKKLSAHIRKSYPKVPWKDMMGMRDKMIHHYFGINYEIVWTISKEELPGLLPQIEKYWPRRLGGKI